MMDFIQINDTDTIPNRRDLKKRWIKSMRRYALLELARPDPPTEMPSSAFTPLPNGTQAYRALIMREVTLTIFSFLSTRDVATAARVRREWLLVANRVLWRLRDVPLSALLAKANFLHQNNNNVWLSVRIFHSQVFLPLSPHILLRPVEPSQSPSVVKPGPSSFTPLI